MQIVDHLVGIKMSGQFYQIELHFDWLCKDLLVKFLYIYLL